MSPGWTHAAGDTVPCVASVWARVPAAHGRGVRARTRDAPASHLTPLVPHLTPRPDPIPSHPLPIPRTASVITNSSGKGLAVPPLDLTPPANASAWGYTACGALYLATVAACFAPEVGPLGS